MSILPTVARELRISARNALTYWLRTCALGVALIISFWFGMLHGFSQDMGSRLFQSLHVTVFCSIWLLVPIMTADCISHERREGTLGLLFMTPLTGTDVVIAKSFVHGLRALSLLFAIMPILTIPFLMGGMSWNEALSSALLNLSAMMLALAAGVLASALSKQRLRALIVTALLGLAFFVMFEVTIGLTLSGITTPLPIGMWRTRAGLDYYCAIGIIYSIAGPQAYARMVAMLSTAQTFQVMAQICTLASLTLAFVVILAGRKTQTNWQEDGPSKTQTWFNKVFCTPVIWVGFLKGWMRGRLERNPIGWLEQRTWSGRLVTWGWLAVTVALYSAILSHQTFFPNYNSMQTWLAWLMCGSMALSAAGSFRRERESGVLELLLVSPLHEGDIILGRVTGLWAQFFPSFALLLGAWAYIESFLQYSINAGGIIVFFAFTYVTLPVIGLYFSLLCRTFLSAFICTVAVGLIVPIAIPFLFLRIWSLAWINLEINWSGSYVVTQLFLALVCWARLDAILRARSFTWQRTEAH
jgi:ABC-type transport system involved in multi-copper enzyme maturation permease subunit